LKQNTSTGLVALRLFLKTAEIGQADISHEIGCTRQWVRDVLNGRVRPSPNFVRDVPLVLAEQLTADPDELRAIFFPEQTDERITSVIGRRVEEAATA
jgi:hypothetical protein